MPTRADLEKNEDRSLSPYAMRSGQSAGRCHREEEHPLRPAYQRDRERIIHCTAFRRLEYKTQVFVNHEGDHFRTRLTHTMEVAQIARAAARVLNVNEDLCEAVALAHDLGHTPFGHSGEDALKELMKEHGGFEHNLHGLRVVDVLEQRYADFRGLNLTWEVRESIAKHCTAYDHPACMEFNPEKKPLAEAQVVEVSDGIAYISHDLDDALAAGILEDKVFDEVPLLRQVRKEAIGKRSGLPPAILRKEIVRCLINKLVSDLTASSLACIQRLGIRSVEQVRDAKENVVCFSPELGALKDELQAYLLENVYHHYRVARMSSKARFFVEKLFRAYIADTRQLPPEYQDWVRQAGLHQGVCDYIAGMTDRYAQDEYQKLFAPFERT